MGKRYVTIPQSKAYCFCPHRYYLSFVKKRTTCTPIKELLSEMTEIAYAELLGMERKYLSDTTGASSIETAYSLLADAAIAHAISMKSRLLEDIDFEGIVSHIYCALQPELITMMKRSMETMEKRGVKGSELALLCTHDPALIDIRMVDHRNKISGTVPKVCMCRDRAFPLLTTTSLVTNDGPDYYEYMAMEMAALLTASWAKKPVTMAALYSLPAHFTYYHEISDFATQSVKSFVSCINETKTYPALKMRCGICPFRNICEYNADCY